MMLWIDFFLFRLVFPNFNWTRLFLRVTTRRIDGQKAPFAISAIIYGPINHRTKVHKKFFYGLIEDWIVHIFITLNWRPKFIDGKMTTAQMILCRRRRRLPWMANFSPIPQELFSWKREFSPPKHHREQWLFPSHSSELKCAYFNAGTGDPAA